MSIEKNGRLFMNKTLINDLGAHAGRQATLCGWVYGKRSGGRVIFLQVRDGSGICQCVVEAQNGDVFLSAEKLTRESSVEVTGLVNVEPRAPGGFEMKVSGINIIQIAGEYPITPKSHGIDFLMNHRHLWLRSKRPAVIMKIRDTIIFTLRKYFHDNGFMLVDTPILVPGAGEDAQTLFNVEYFERKLFLAQTGQLYLENACMAYGKVYCFGPTFRAEKSKTRRHLTEFWMLEPEIAYAKLEDVMDLAEDMTVKVVEAVLEKHEEDLKFLGRDVERLRNVKKPFVRMTYTDAANNLRSAETKAWLEKELEHDKAKLQDLIIKLTSLEDQHKTAKNAWQVDKLTSEMHDIKEEIADLDRDIQNGPEHIKLAQEFEWGGDLGGSDETIISRQFDKPVFVTHYPKEAKAFYMKKDYDDDRVVRNMDMLAPEGYGEIIGGSQREDDLDVLVERIKEQGLKPEDYDWYLDLRRYGSVPHGGFGLGIERLMTWICGLKHVRETIAFPRTMGKIYQ